MDNLEISNYKLIVSYPDPTPKRKGGLVNILQPDTIYIYRQLGYGNEAIQEVHVANHAMIMQV